MKYKVRFPAFIVGTILTLCGAPAFADDTGSAVINRTIGYVLVDDHWAVYTTKDAKEECPQGTNVGNREQFKELYPEGTKRTVAGTSLVWEANTWFPKSTPDPFPFKLASGKTAIGLNLDGKVGPNDFTSPEGEIGIDNQLFRAVGCIDTYRGPDGFLYFFNNKWMQQYNYARFLIELTDVDSLVNDDDVTVTSYRGLDGLRTDAGGSGFLPYGSQRADMRWGKKFIQKWHGKIVDGVLTTDTQDMNMPAVQNLADVTFWRIRDARFRLKLAPDGAEGFLGGYVDIKAFYRQLNLAWATVSQAFGRLASPSLTRALYRLADAHPDPTTGQNTAISGARIMQFKQVFIQHPDKKTAELR